MERRFDGDFRLGRAAYSLLRSGSIRPLADAAGSFVRCTPFAMILLGLGLAWQMPSQQGLTLAVASGSIISGLGYAI
ncbi:MAG: hypothetical protein MO846_10080 [Candidatus Devosia symbiotica]|nr:hypothetical protein [Candidatus Devosia symbiotica]